MGVVYRKRSEVIFKMEGKLWKVKDITMRLAVQDGVGDRETRNMFLALINDEFNCILQMDIKTERGMMHCTRDRLTIKRGQFEKGEFEG